MLMDVCLNLAADDELNSDMQVVQNLVNKCIAMHVESLISASVDEQSAKIELQGMIHLVLDWVSFITRSNSAQKVSQLLSCSGSLNVENDMVIQKTPLQWLSVYSKEETILSPMLGIKGQVDLIMETRCTYTDSNSNTTFVKDAVIPVELKTGKWRPNGLIGHRAQVRSVCVACNRTSVLIVTC